MTRKGHGIVGEPVEVRGQDTRRADLAECVTPPLVGDAEDDVVDPGAHLPIRRTGV